MSMKLVRTDSPEPCKIQLTKGEHFIGRGKLLGCDDKRISRNHGHLLVYDDHVTIKALHQNPCFYIKCGTDEKQILKKGVLIDLSNGDRFGLLPDAFWYEVLLCSLHTQQLQDEISDKDTEDYILEQGPETNESKTDVSEFKTSKFDETTGDNVRVESPSLIPSSNLNIDIECATNSLIQSHKVNDCNITSPQHSDLPEHESRIVNEEVVNNESTHVLKRSNSSEQLDNTKKVKVEPIEVTKELKVDKTESKEIKKESEGDKIDSNNIQPGPSLCQARDGASASDNPRFAAQPNNRLRERCMYGANCYRKNPAHLAQFSHPRDADWGTEAQAPCPYGAACTRRDPRHHRDHRHPPAHRPPPRPDMRVVQRHGNVFYINAHAVHFYDDHFQVEDSDGESVDLDYEF